MKAITSNRHTAHIRNLTVALTTLPLDTLAALNSVCALQPTKLDANALAAGIAETQTALDIKRAFAVAEVKDLIIPVELAAWLDGDIDLIVDEDDTDLV